jgi:hypothetical protein
MQAVCALAVVACAVCATLLVGCLPLPIGHTVYEVPHTTGTVASSDGEPVAGVEVWQFSPIYRRGHCADARDTATVAVTGADGTFELPAVTRQDRWRPVGMVDRFGALSMCVALEGEPVRVVVQEAHGPALPPEATVSCVVGQAREVRCQPRGLR